jgi:hypothetical protein
MKKYFYIFAFALISVNSLFAQTDQGAVYNWQWPIDYWFSGYVPNEPYTRNTAEANPAPANFDAATTNFDDAWNGIPGNGYAIASALGNAPSNHGAADFAGAFKVYYDDVNIYILLKYTDDDITGNESVEIPISPKLKIDAIDNPVYPGIWYTRNMEFGAYKALFKKSGFTEAMMINHDANGKGSINWGGTTPVLSNNLYLNDRGATSGAGVVKQIITIGYTTLTGTAFPTFDTDVWKTINDGNGISLDVKVNDVDANDALDTSNPPVAKPAEYWWNTTDNNCWASTAYAGYLKIKTTTAVHSVLDSPRIFGKVTKNEITLTDYADVTLSDISGKQLKQFRAVNSLNVSDLRQGIYLVSANNQTLKFAK